MDIKSKLSEVPQTLIELEANRKLVAETFQIMESYLDEFLYTDEMKKDLQDFKWNTLGNYDADISDAKNTARLIRWGSLTCHVRAN